MSTRTSRPRGFVIIAALFFITLTALLIMAISRGFAAESARTRQQAQQTQLEQLLLAGSDTLRAGNKSLDLTPTLPPELQQAGYRLTFNPSQNTLTATTGRQAKSLALQ